MQFHLMKLVFGGRKQHTSARILKKFDWIGEEYFANEGSKEKDINLWY